MANLRTLIERQIKKALAEGKLSNLEGEGKPLPYRPGDALIDAGDAAGMRMMAEAGVLPPEITLKKELDESRAAWTAATDEAEKKRLMSKITDLEMRYNMARETRQAFFKR